MDLGTALVGGTFSVICVLPFIYMNKRSKQHAAKMQQKLNEIAIQHKGIIHQHEICGDMAIGLDRINSVFFFYKEMDGQIISTQIKLSEVGNCKVVKTNRVVGDEHHKQTLIDRVDLQFQKITPGKNLVNFVFFDSAHTMQLNGELQMAEEWAKIINTQLNSL